MTLPSSTRRLTAAQIIVLAADDLVNSGFDEFSEWQLTVAAWKRDRERFGLRGFQDHHPDHKRVMMEIMGQKPHNPIHTRLMEKVRPNYYRMTPAGHKEAERLLEQISDSAHTEPTPPAPKKSSVMASPPAPAPKAMVRKPATPDEMYDGLYDQVFHPTFFKWKDEPSYPKSWSDVSAFLGVRKGASKQEATDALDQLAQLCQYAIEYCKDQDIAFLSHGRKGIRRINLTDLNRLGDFLELLGKRFASEFERPAKRRKSLSS